MEVPSSQSSNTGFHETLKDMPKKSDYTMKWNLRTTKSTLKLEKVGVENKSAWNT